MSDYDIQIGMITAVSGIRGNLKIRCFLENPEDIANFKHIYDANGRIYKIHVISLKKDIIVASIENISSRNTAQQFVNTILMIKRSSLPKTKSNEFYYSDLIGSKVVISGSEVMIGVVKNIYNFGATDILEIFDCKTGKFITCPFSKNFISETNLSKRYIGIKAIEKI